MAVKPNDNFLIGKLDWLANYVRANSLWPMPFATACCGIELMATASSRFDLARFGSEAMRFSPRQCDVMIVAGRVVMKMVPVMQRIWLQMPEPKWCISMGACASSGGVFDTYAVVQGIDRFIPVDIYVPGCPPRPEQLIRAIMDLQDRVKATGTFLGTEYKTRTESEKPKELHLVPGDAIVAPGDYRTATKEWETKYPMTHEEILAKLQAACGAAVVTSEFRDNFRLIVPVESIFAALKCLKEQCGFNMLADVTAVDYLKYPEAKDRYAVVYCLTNITTGMRLVVKTYVNDPDPTVPSCFPLWSGADWMEREVFDMYGIVFAGHPDLRRILMPDEFTSFPLRKDYPLRGRHERHNFPLITRAES